MDYDETSQEAITAIAMIKSMTTSPRRGSVLPKSPLLPRINNRTESQRASFSKAGVFVNNGSYVAAPSRSSSWPTRGVALASIEFKKKLERRKTRHCKSEMNVDTRDNGASSLGRTDFAARESPRKTVLTSIFANGREISNSGTSGNTFPQQLSSSSNKSPSNATSTTDGFSQPLLSIAKITPLRRPKFPDHRSRGHHVN